MISLSNIPLNCLGLNPETWKQHYLPWLHCELPNLNFSTLLIFDRVLENTVFSPGFWFRTKSKFEVKFYPQPFSYAIEFMLLHRFYLGEENGLQNSEQNLRDEKLLKGKKPLLHNSLLRSQLIINIQNLENIEKSNLEKLGFPVIGY